MCSFQASSDTSVQLQCGASQGQAATCSYLLTCCPDKLPCCGCVWGRAAETAAMPVLCVGGGGLKQLLCQCCV